MDCWGKKNKNKKTTLFVFWQHMTRYVKFTRKQQDVPTASGRTSVKLINTKPQSPLSGRIHIHPHPYARDHPGQILYLTGAKPTNRALSLLYCPWINSKDPPQITWLSWTFNGLMMEQFNLTKSFLSALLNSARRFKWFISNNFRTAECAPQVNISYVFYRDH